MTALVQRLGASALISFHTNPAGIPATLLDSGGSASALLYELPATVGSLPEPGETVHCWSDAGQWSTTVRETRPGVMVLERPTWLVRSQERRSIRVEASMRVTLDAGGTQVAGRLIDLSVGGGAVVVEAAVAPLAGANLAMTLPRGETVHGVVRSRRLHAHRLLRVLGVEWTSLDGRVERWLNGEVTNRLRARRSRGATTPP